MKRKIIYALLICQLWNTVSVAQTMPPLFLTDGKGNLIHERQNSTIEGCPFVPEEYSTAAIKITNGNMYENLLVRIDFSNNSVYCKIDTTSEMIVAAPIEKIIFLPSHEMPDSTIFQSGFPKIDRQNEQTYYQVLDTGKNKLLKYFKIKYFETVPYAKSSSAITYQKEELYYAFIKNKALMIPLAKNKDAVIEVLSDKKILIEKFIADNNLKCKKEKDLIKVFSYYNSITN